MTDPYENGFFDPYGAPPPNQSGTERFLFSWGQEDGRQAREDQTAAYQPSSHHADEVAIARYHEARALYRESVECDKANKSSLGYDGEYGVPFDDCLYKGGFSKNNPSYYAEGLKRFFNGLSTREKGDYSQIFKQCSDDPSFYHPCKDIRPYNPLEKMMDGFMLRPEPSKAEHAGARWCYDRGLLLGNRYIPTKLEQIESRKSLLRRTFNWRTTYWAPGVIFLHYYRHFMFPTVNEVAPQGPRLQHQYIDPIDTAAYRTDEKYREFVNLRNFGVRPE